MSAKKLWTDTKAVSYPLFLIILTLIIGTVVWIIATPAVNVMTDSFNTQIDDGAISTQTVNCYAFNVNLFKILPIFFLVGLLCYGIVQALLRKNTEG